MSQWTDFIAGVVSGVQKNGVQEVGAYETQVDSDARAFLAQTKTDLQTWTTQLTQGQITKDDFSENIQAEGDLAKLQALTDAGLGLTALQSFRSALVNIVISVAFKVFLP